MDMLNLKPETTGKRALNRQRNRRAILDAARDCFQENGYDNSSIRDIVRRTNLASGTFYNYFSSKKDIFAALLTDFLTSLNEDMTTRRNAATSTRELIYSTYHALYSATAKDPVIYELAHQNQRALRNLFGSDILGLTLLSLEQDVRAAIDRGLLPKTDPDYLCATFFGVAYDMSLLVARKARTCPDSVQDEAERAAKFSTDLFLGGLPALATLPSKS
ncbi:TetR/AcrR family transcriptional regulator [Marinobacter litoralis]|uniref:TetR/AcrR family transcriptional regulator n=1 Tax=Marinobacter litoralis TaxID=187981 RepID=UPI0018EDC81C|nr:TetR/AcrR family transcriptional regulator [Marinobacter litoralis]MBJ6137567.1 TetR/AcrR family transcriptional regulator [Marinobacter litoralis]